VANLPCSKLRTTVESREASGWLADVVDAFARLQRVGHAQHDGDIDQQNGYVEQILFVNHFMRSRAHARCTFRGIIVSPQMAKGP